MKRIVISIIFLGGSMRGCPTLVTRPGKMPDRITIFYHPPQFLFTCSVDKNVPMGGKGYADKS